MSKAWIAITVDDKSNVVTLTVKGGGKAKEAGKGIIDGLRRAKEGTDGVDRTVEQED